MTADTELLCRQFVYINSVFCRLVRLSHVVSWPELRYQ